ncbi:MAG: chromosome segregation protein SMC [Acidimicrobiia bacterium]
MHLKSLSLSGFKSFADRTRLDFEPGVNVVVGPNGSGKSNIVDAVSWVLGTQATSNLRTNEMKDVIFSGTASRPALNRTEVTVTFDNAERQLPLDLEEVSITRRLLRDGTSEYEINGTDCRLLDIQELLNDGHVGRHLHVIVAQGRIASILNARPDEHRTVLEEAAGVVKHRNRRDRSIRRLEQTADDVKRLQDILREHNKRMRPLKRQAVAAEKHESVKEEVRALYLHIGATELRSIDGRLDAATTEEATRSERVTAAIAELAELERELAGLQDKAGDAGKSLERDTAAAARLETIAERFHKVATVARERRVALESSRRGHGERRRDLELEAQDLFADLQRAEAEDRLLRSKVDRAATALRALEDEERVLADQGQLPAEGVLAVLRGEQASLEGAAERDRRDAEAVAHRLELIAARTVDEAAEVERLSVESQQLDIEVGAIAATYDVASQSREKAQRAWETAEEAWQQAQFEVTRCRARVEATEAALSGVTDESSRDMVASSAHVVASIVEALDVPEGLAVAVEVALGHWSDGVVADGLAGVESVVAELKSGGVGGIPVVTAAASPVRSASKIAAEWGVDALVERLGPGADQQLAQTLLGDVLLVEGWKTAWDLLQRAPDLRAVTPEGDLITATGIRAYDPAGIDEAGLEDAKAAEDRADDEARRAESRLAVATRAFDEARGAERSALESLEVLETRLGGATEALARIQRAKADSDAEVARLDEQRRLLAEAAVARDERLVALRSRLDAFEGEDARHHEAWAELSERKQKVGVKREQAQGEREAAAAELAKTEERRRMLEERRVDVATQLEGWDDAPVEAFQIDGLEITEDMAKRAMEVVRGHVATLRERQRTLRTEAGFTGTKLGRVHERQKTLEAETAESRERLAALAVEIAEGRARRQGVAEGLRRDADATEEQALQAPAVEVDDPRARLDQLEAELRRMGPVNPLAAKEYRELAAEAEFLDGQLADLNESRSELRKVITVLDSKIAELFTAAFEEIDRFYQENFSVLFPGGKGRLRLTDPDNPLETGLEIQAQPMGKKVSRLSLLSGGERSLAALAFLFAVFRARPSPFYVLDEVEAALDDANLRRFLKLIEMLRGSSQLVVITHQQQTMEAADMLYGVTMEPGESSKVLAKRFDHARV